MPLPASSRAQFAADLTICRTLNGMWQVSGAHGAVDPVRAVDAMSAYHEAGFTTWDLADHYGPAEDFIGDFLRRFAARHGVDRPPEIQAFTKWVPRPGRMTRRVVEDAISISLTRMGVERLDLLQFHWRDYKNDCYLAALKHLSDLQQEGKIRHLALTNFDTERLSAIADHGVRVVSNQVQYSLVDRRPEVRMARFCSDHPMTLLAYGTLLGWRHRPTRGRSISARDAACAARPVAGRYRTSRRHLAISTRNFGPQTVAGTASADLGGGARSGDLRLGHSSGCQHHGDAAITPSCGSRHTWPAIR
jgi:aryl-alcohol dehydrogenase-like predicted oxidoreductase